MFYYRNKKSGSAYIYPADSAISVLTPEKNRSIYKPSGKKMEPLQDVE